MALNYVKNKIIFFLNNIKYCSKNINYDSTSHISLKSELKCDKDAKINFGQRVSISSGCVIQGAGGGCIEFIGNTFVNKNCFFVSREKILIGSGCTFGPNVLIYDHDHGIKWDKRNEYKTAEVAIGNNCWIGANCIILKGTTIGENCVIGAGTLVKGKIPSNSIVYNEKNLLIKEIID